MSNQSVLRVHLPVIQQPELPTHVSTENIPTDDEPPPAYTPYATTVAPPVSSASLRQMPSFLSTCPPPPSIPAPPRPVRGISPGPRGVSPGPRGVSPGPRLISPGLRNEERARTPTRSNVTQSALEVPGGMQVQEVRSGENSKTLHLTEHQSEASHQVQSSYGEGQSHFSPTVTEQEQQERQLKQVETVPPGQREVDPGSVQLSDRRIKQEDRHQLVRQPEAIQTTPRRDEQSRLLKQLDIGRTTPTEEAQGRLRRKSQTRPTALKLKEEDNSRPQVSRQAERVLQQSERTPALEEPRNPEQPSVGTPVVTETQQACLVSHSLHHDDEERGTDSHRSSKERSVLTHELAVPRGATKEIVWPIYHNRNDVAPQPSKRDEDDLPILPVVMLDDLPPPPSPIRMSSSTEHLLFNDE